MRAFSRLCPYNPYTTKELPKEFYKLTIFLFDLQSAFFTYHSQISVPQYHTCNKLFNIISKYNSRRTYGRRRTYGLPAAV
jgi:hypothetical protein